MNVFDLHDRIVSDYASYIKSFINIADPAIRKKVHSALSEGKLWPDPLLQFNPAYEQAGSVEDIAQTGVLHHAMPDIFKGYSLSGHQLDAIRLGVAGKDFVVTSGTGSGKSLTYIGSIFHQAPRRTQNRRRVSSHRLSDERPHQFPNQRIQHLQKELRGHHRSSLSHNCWANTPDRKKPDPAYKCRRTRPKSS